MREVVKKINAKINSVILANEILTESQECYVTGLREALEIIENSVNGNIIPERNYFVITYIDGDKFMPQIEEMRLTKITEKAKRFNHCFSRNLNATKNTAPDLVLSSSKSVKERVFFTKEQAERAINK